MKADLTQPLSADGGPVPESFPQTQSRLKLLGWLAGGLCLAFIRPLLGWFQLALHSEIHSCILLIPFICAWLGWQKRQELPVRCNSAPAIGVMLIALGLVALSAVHWLEVEGRQASATDTLALRIGALFLFLNGLAFQLLGVGVMRQLAFPAAFLVFMIPLPDVAVQALEYFFQHTSAEAASMLFTVTDSVVFRDGLTFQLPGAIVIRVAQECSGIRSSYALFLTSLLAGHLLLRCKLNKIMLAVLVIPLGIVRNGFRIFSLATLSVHYGAWILDSPLHHQGGPVFFVLSLIPFLALVWWMMRREKRHRAKLTGDKG